MPPKVDGFFEERNIDFKLSFVAFDGPLSGGGIGGIFELVKWKVIQILEGQNNTNDGEDIWGLEGDIVKFSLSFGPFGEARDDICGDTVQLFKCEGNAAL